MKHVFTFILGDILIERWMPYGPQPERRTIIQRAPSPIRYPEPTHTIIEYDNIQPHIVRKFERLGVEDMNPSEYRSLYETPLLNSSALLQQARNLGVTEDLVNF